jgi:hypothetical protein
MFRPIRSSSGVLKLLKLLHFCTLSYFVSISYKSKAYFRLCAAYVVVCFLVMVVSFRCVVCSCCHPLNKPVNTRILWWASFRPYT